jgi:hypothetical protein
MIEVPEIGMELDAVIQEVRGTYATFKLVGFRDADAWHVFPEFNLMLSAMRYASRLQRLQARRGGTLCVRVLRADAGTGLVDVQVVHSKHEIYSGRDNRV